MITVFILLDGFRPDYLKKAPFMERLSRTSLTGELKPPFGFMSTSGAIFAGLEPEASNLCYKFCFSPQTSPFNFIKKNSSLDPARGLRNFFITLKLRCKEKGALAGYGTPALIPQGLLPYFDFGQKKRPDEDGFVPVFSLFDILRKEKKGFLYLGFARPKSIWQYGRKIAQRMISRIYDEDADLIKILKRDIKHHNYDFIYLHLNLLDSLGHYFGPASGEMEEGLRKVDRRIEELYGLFKNKFNSFNFILAADHGMTEVKKTIDIWKIILNFKLKIGTDFIPFLDATTARFWGKAESLDYIRGRLAALNGGNFLETEDLFRFQIRFKDNRYGELFWVCEEGVVIAPNFFDEAPLKGAHGYLPGTKTDYAFFLCHGEGIRPGLTDGSLQDIFPTFLKTMGLVITPGSKGKALF